MAYFKTGRCRRCGAAVEYLTYGNSKGCIPCDTPSVHFVPDYEGPHTLLDVDVRWVDGYVVPEKAAGSSKAWIPHSKTCKGRKRAGEGRKPKSAELRRAEAHAARLASEKAAPQGCSGQITMFAL